MTRHGRIGAALDRCLENGEVRSWFSSSPDGRKRWSVEVAGLGTRVWGVNEVEAFLDGISAHRHRGLR